MFGDISCYLIHLRHYFIALFICIETSIQHVLMPHTTSLISQATLQYLPLDGDSTVTLHIVYNYYTKLNNTYTDWLLH